MNPKNIHDWLYWFESIWLFFKKYCRLSENLFFTKAVILNPNLSNHFMWANVESKYFPVQWSFPKTTRNFFSFISRPPKVLTIRLSTEFHHYTIIMKSWNLLRNFFKKHLEFQISLQWFSVLLILLCIQNAFYIIFIYSL